jgi:murein DD-endopeptidase MepM/ murein hydrolase activator NlpD
MPRHRTSRPSRFADAVRSLRNLCLTAVSVLLLMQIAACTGVGVGTPIDPRYWQLRNQEMPVPLPLVPVQGVALAQLQDTYGAPRSGGRSHEGIDIFAPRDTPVVSTTEGYVTAVATNRLGGNVVWVMGPGGYRHYYAHLEGWSDVRDGDWVEPGTVLGFVGNSGNAAPTPPHLHYGVYRPTGGSVNPYDLLTARPGDRMETIAP